MYSEWQVFLRHGHSQHVSLPSMINSSLYQRLLSYNLVEGQSFLILSNRKYVSRSGHITLLR